MRTTYLVSYDIMDPKRLNKVFKTMRGFGEHLQYSVFICNLSAKEKALLIAALTDSIDGNEDRILIVTLGNSGGDALDRIEFLGKQSPLPDREPLIV